MQRDPAGVPAHHLDDEHAAVRLRGGVQAVDRFHGDVDRGVEAERVVGGVEVVVDGLGHADDLHAVLVQGGRDAERVLAADGDQGLDRKLRRFSSMRSTPPSTFSGLVRDEPRIVPPRGRMPRTDSARRARAVALERPAPAVTEADEVVPVARDALAHDGADHCVQARDNRRLP